MKNKNSYDKFVEAILALPFDVRTAVMNIGQKNTNTGNPFHYLFKRIQKRDLEDPIYCLMVEKNLLTNEMILK